MTRVVTQRPVAEAHYEMIMAAHWALEKTEPGQFITVGVSAPGSCDPLLRRPFSLYRRLPNGDYSFVYRVVGRGTQALSRLAPGAPIDVLGPLGRGFTPIQGARRIALVGGGVGVPPLLFLAQRTLVGTAEIKALLGFQTSAFAFGHDTFAAMGVETYVATADGTLGERGLATDLLLPLLEQRSIDALYACGPKPMLAAVARMIKPYGIPAQFAFEEAMACGVGACLSCVLPIRTAQGVERMRVCKEGPVFAAEEVVFDE